MPRLILAFLIFTSFTRLSFHLRFRCIRSLTTSLHPELVDLVLQFCLTLDLALSPLAHFRAIMVVDKLRMEVVKGLSFFLSSSSSSSSSLEPHVL
jgi:hypothetical protein